MRNCVGGFFLKVAGRPELPVAGVNYFFRQF
jgi:hypothetical protein